MTNAGKANTMTPSFLSLEMQTVIGMNLETSRESGAIHYPERSFFRRIAKTALR
jgi:hypothetical protein